MTKAVYMIKPEAMENRPKIREKIERVGLRISSFKILELNEDTLIQLYPDHNEDIWNATKIYMMYKECEIGIVEGSNVIDRLFQVGGKFTNPNMCEKGTIRERYGIKKGIEIGQSIYYKNAFHRSQNIEEARRDLKIYDSLK